MFAGKLHFLMIIDKNIGPFCSWYRGFGKGEPCCFIYRALKYHLEVLPPCQTIILSVWSVQFHHNYIQVHLRPSQASIYYTSLFIICTSDSLLKLRVHYLDYTWKNTCTYTLHVCMSTGLAWFSYGSCCQAGRQVTWQPVKFDAHRL